MAHDFISCDIETAGHLDPREGPIDQIGFGYGPGQTYREKYTEAHRHQYQQILNSGKRIVFHNGPFDIPYMSHYDYHTPLDKYEDTMFGMHLLNPDIPLGLEVANSLFVHHKPWWGTKTKNLQKWSTPSYHATDLDVTWQAWAAIEANLKAEGKWQLYRTESIPVSLACMDLKRHGIRVDAELMKRMWLVWSKRIEQFQTQLSRIAPINWESPLQVAELLYKKWNMPEQFTIGSDRKKHITTNEKAIETLMIQTGHPALKLLVYMRKLAKQRSTYLEWPLDDKGFYHFDIAFLNATGRARGDMLVIQHGPMRSIFLPDEPEWEFADADWSMVELWIGAVVSGDEHYQETLRHTKFHEYAGKMVLNKEVNKRTQPDLYLQMKAISHGKAFGRGDRAICAEHNIPMTRVQAYDKWLEKEFPVWWQWRKDQIETAEVQGKLTNSFNFTRYFWGGNIDGMALAHEPQSDVAHMIKRMLVRLQAELPKPARVVLPWHDAVVITYPPELKEESLACLKENMECAWEELRGWRGQSEIKTGKNLMEATEAA